LATCSNHTRLEPPPAYPSLSYDVKEQKTAGSVVHAPAEGRFIGLAWGDVKRFRDAFLT
jgi:hypothetical protein